MRAPRVSGQKKPKVQKRGRWRRVAASGQESSCCGVVRRNRENGLRDCYPDDRYFFTGRLPVCPI